MTTFIAKLNGRPVIMFPPDWTQEQIASWCRGLNTVQDWREWRECYYLGIMVSPFGQELSEWGHVVYSDANKPWGMSVHGVPKLHPQDE